MLSTELNVPYVDSSMLVKLKANLTNKYYVNNGSQQLLYVKLFNCLYQSVLSMKEF